MSEERRSLIIVSSAVAVLLALLMASAGFSQPAVAPRSGHPLPVRGLTVSGLYFDYVVIILLENHNLCDVYYGNATGSPCGTAPTGGVYETHLAELYSIPLDDHYCHTNPSLPNYLCLSGGTTFSCTQDVNPNTGCATAAWNAPNIVDRLEAGGLTWKAYMESMPANCTSSDSGRYAVRHDPFMYYNDIASSSARCKRVVPAGPGASDSTFLNDLNSTPRASNYMWLTPNLDNDAHDTTVAYADGYLSRLVPLILGSPVFTTQRAALFITYDEGYGPPTFAEWAGPVVKNGFNSTKAYDHFSVVKTIEDNWKLPYLTANVSSATNMSEFFKPATPDFSIAANPPAVYFKPGGSNTTDIDISSQGGFSGLVDLTNSSSPSGLTVACTPSSITPSQVSVCTFNATSANSYTVTITGTSGALVHSVTIPVTVSTSPPPVTSITVRGAAGANGWYVTRVNVSLRATNLGPSGTIYYHIDSGAWQAYFDYFFVGDGSHTIFYNATNSAGIHETTHSAAVKVDTAPPSVIPSLIGIVGANGWYTSAVSVTLQAVDNASGLVSVSYRIDAGSIQSSPSSPSFFVTDGTHVVLYFATDLAGLRSANGTLALKIDSAPPAFHNASPSGLVTQSPVTVSWNATASSGISGYRVRVDNGTYRNLGLRTSLQLNLTDGPHVVQVVATDVAGLNNATLIQFQVGTGGVGTSTWPILLPLFATIAVLAAFGIAFFVLRLRRRRQGGGEWPDEPL